MTDLLQCAYVEKRCNACGGAYRVSLRDMLVEHEVRREWQPERPCSLCSLENRDLMWAIPLQLIEELRAAWERVRQAADDAQVELRVGG